MGLKHYYATLLAYSITPNSETGDIDGLETISGSSINYLSNKKTCWAYVGECSENEGLCELNNRRLENFLLPAKISAEKSSPLKSTRNFTLEDLVKDRHPEQGGVDQCNFSELELISLARNVMGETPGRKAPAPKPLKAGGGPQRDPERP